MWGCSGAKLCRFLQMAQFSICLCLGTNDNKHSAEEELSSSRMTLRVIPSFTSPQLKPPPKELMQMKTRDVLMDFSLPFPENTPKSQAAATSEEWVSNKEDRACQAWGLGVKEWYQYSSHSPWCGCSFPWDS